jgi:hypothetical protein
MIYIVISMEIFYNLYLRAFTNNSCGLGCIFEVLLNRNPYLKKAGNKEDLFESRTS